MAYVRDKTRPQGDRPIFNEQRNFGGGLNVDIPASDINNNELSVSENVIAFERYLEGRSGSVKINATMPTVSNSLHSVAQHTENGAEIFHWGSQLFNGATEIKDYAGTPASLGVDSASTLKQFGDNFLLFTTSGIYMILIAQGQNKFFQVNAGQPTIPLNYTSPGGDYRYRYLAVYSMILDSSGDRNATGLATANNRYTSTNQFIWETPPVFYKTRPDLKFYKEIFVANAITAGNKVTLDLSSLVTAAATNSKNSTHISIYRTEDLGVNGLDDLNNGQYALVADIPLSNTTYDDEMTDGVIQNRKAAGGYLNDVQGWEAIPSGDIGEVTDAFMFTATRGEDTLYYNQLENPEHIGFYSSAFQYQKFQDQINVLAATPDVLTIALEGSTHICSLNSWTNPLGDDGEAIDFIASLNHYTPIDRTIGVKDYGSFAEVEQGTYIAVCSDKSVRIWDGAGWSDDYSKDKVNSIIETIVEGVSVGIYYKGAYLLWYTDDLTATPANATPTKCLRLSLKRESGKGWTQYTGSDWPLPPPLTGVYIFNNKDSSAYNGDDLLYVVDVTDEERYWIETFDGASNTNTQNNTSSMPIKKYYGDKMSDAAPTGIGTEIIPKFKGKEISGARESFNILHSESHIYMRDVTTQLTRATLAIDALAYVDSSSTPTETVGRISAGHDIQFWRRVEGSRIAIEYEMNRSGIIVTGTDTRYRVQDIKRPAKSAVQAVAGTFQTEWASNFLHWVFTRPTALWDRVTGKKFTSNGVDTETAPDSRSTAIKIDTDTNPNPYVLWEVEEFSNLQKSITDFTISFWCKDPSITGSYCPVVRIYREDTANHFDVNFSSTTNLRVVLGGNNDFTIDDISDGEWHHFCLVSDSDAETLTVYQNDVDKGNISWTNTLYTYKIEIGTYLLPS